MQKHTWDDIRRGLKLYNDEDTDSPYYINSKTYERSVTIANTMEAFEFPVPRMFCHGGDTVAFIWGLLGESGSKPLQMYVNITDEGVSRLNVRNHEDKWST